MPLWTCSSKKDELCAVKANSRVPGEQGGGCTPLPGLSSPVLCSPGAGKHKAISVSGPPAALGCWQQGGSSNFYWRIHVLRLTDKLAPHYVFVFYSSF